MRIDILTLFPEMFESVLGSSILKRAAQKPKDRTGLSPKDDNSHLKAPVNYHVHQLRDYTTDKHRKVDKPPFGGGPGMVIQCQPTWDAVKAIQNMDEAPTRRILLTPQGKPLTQEKLEELAKLPRVLLIAGHYEGFDERVIDKLAPIEEISIGDYVLSGGELAAMVLIDGIVRLLPNVLGDQQSALQDSFSQGGTGVSGEEKRGGILDCAHYTRPAVWEGMEIPKVLLSGDHKKIDAWREENAIERTKQRRPDLLDSK